MPSLSAPKPPRILMFFGADRVGKSTLIAGIEKILVGDGKKVKIAHFSGPKPHHHSPIEQYTEVLDPLFKEGFHDFILCDRCGSEVVFYDSWRRRVDTCEQWATSFESYIISRAPWPKILLLKRDWCDVKKFHEKEIVEEAGGRCSAYYMDMQLEGRKKEHQAYYEYMEEYLPHRSKIVASQGPFLLYPRPGSFVDTQEVYAKYV